MATEEKYAELRKEILDEQEGEGDEEDGEEEEEDEDEEGEDEEGEKDNETIIDKTETNLVISNTISPFTLRNLCLNPKGNTLFLYHRLL